MPYKIRKSLLVALLTALPAAGGHAAVRGNDRLDRITDHTAPGLWINAAHNDIKKDRTNKGAGYEFDPTGFMLGYDACILPQKFKIGVALSVIDGTIKTVSTPLIDGKNDIKSVNIALYTQYTLDRLSFFGLLGGGTGTNKTAFNDGTTDATGEYDSRSFFGSFQMGYNLGSGKTTVEPYIGIEYGRYLTDAYTEKGTAARHFGETHHDILETPVGIRIGYDIGIKKFTLTPELDSSFSYNFGDEYVASPLGFTADQNKLWHVASAKDKNGSFKNALTLKIKHQSWPVSANIGYALNIRQDYKDQQIYATLRWDLPAAKKQAGKKETATPAPQAVPEKVETIRHTHNTQLETFSAPVEKPAVKTTAAPKTAPVPVAAEKPSVETPGIWVIQISALYTPKNAEDFWTEITAKKPELKNYTKTITPTSSEEEEALYRLRFGPFESRQEAEELCKELKKGKINCFVPKRIEDPCLKQKNRPCKLKETP